MSENFLGLTKRIFTYFSLKEQCSPDNALPITITHYPLHPTFDVKCDELNQLLAAGLALAGLAGFW
jgi:hypothetical protein